MTNPTTKYAIVSGASRGIGAALVRRLGAMGYPVVMNYVSSSSGALCEELSVELKERHNVDSIAVQGDVGMYEDCARVVQAGVEAFGTGVEVMINNAGVTNNESFLTIDPDHYLWLVQVNLMSNLHFCRLVLPYMVENGGGCIINMASVGGLMGVVDQADYGAAKSGVIGLTRGLAAEFGPKNIRVNAIAPGLIATDMLSGVDQEALAELAKAVPMQRIGDVDDIAGAMEYLINAPYMTGQTISPNGGIVMP